MRKKFIAGNWKMNLDRAGGGGAGGGGGEAGQGFPERRCCAVPAVCLFGGGAEGADRVAGGAGSAESVSRGEGGVHGGDQPGDAVGLRVQVCDFGAQRAAGHFS